RGSGGDRREGPGTARKRGSPPGADLLCALQEPKQASALRAGGTRDASEIQPAARPPPPAP
ncbi:hypothetical protein DBR06_SOUSAS4110187, partial [Sousa chinensis]